jgi:PAS domain S-box-containing protein
LGGVAAVLAAHGDDPQHWLVWNDAAAGEAKPRLFVLPATVRAFAPADLAIPLALATLVFAFAAWATLGRWSVLSLRRVQALRQAQEQFAEDRNLDPAIEAALARASSDVDDEIADVAATLRMMMQTIVSAEAAECEARASLLLSDLVVRNASEGIIVTDADNNIIATNPAFERITGYAAAEALGQNPRLLNSGLQDRAFYQRMWRTLLDTGCWNGELWNRRKNGELYAQRASIVAVPENARGGEARYMALFADVTLEKQQEEALAYQAGHDPLTGLPNRRLLGDRMESALARAAAASAC